MYAPFLRANIELGKALHYKEIDGATRTKKYLRTSHVHLTSNKNILRSTFLAQFSSAAENKPP